MHDIQALIPIQTGQIGASQDIPTVDARNIWQWLEVHKPYAHWIKYQIKRLKLIENVHFIINAPNGINSPGVGRPEISYHVTLDAAKHIVMVSHTERGAEARDYFIEIEKRYRTGEHGGVVDGDMLVQMALAYRDQQKQIKAIEAQQRQDQLAMIQQQHDMLVLQEKHMALQLSVIEAKDNALLAIQSMQWVTIRQYVEIYGMHHQMPPPVQRSYATWLNSYCLERNFAMYKAATADKTWPYEKTYCIAVIQDTLPGWLSRHAGSDQQSLTSDPGERHE